MDTDAPKAPAPDPAQKYIRTFAGDMEVAKQGGTPDLKPLVEDPVIVPKDIPILSPVEAAPIVTPEWNEKVRQETLARLHAKVQADEATRPTGGGLAAHMTEGVSMETPSPIHTYAEDFSDHVKAEHASRVTVLAAEQDAGKGTPEPETQESPLRRVVFVIGGVLLLGLGIGGVYVAYTNYAANTTPVVVAPAIVAPLFVNEQEQLVGDGTELLRAIEASVQKPLSEGSVRLLVSTNATTTREGLFVHLPVAAPNILLRNVIGADSMVGVLHTGNTQSAFFILSVASYNETFAGLLQWEPSITRDLAILFPPYPAVIAPVTTATTTVATSTPRATTTPLAIAPPPTFTAGFRDEVIANHDVRVYRDAAGRSVLLYGYFDPSTLIIARDEAALIELLGRLSNAHSSQ